MLDAFDPCDAAPFRAGPLARQPATPTLADTEASAPPPCWGASGALVAELDDLLGSAGFPGAGPRRGGCCASFSLDCPFDSGIPSAAPGLDVLLLSAPEAEALAFAFAAQGGAGADEVRRGLTQRSVGDRD